MSLSYERIWHQNLLAEGSVRCTQQAASPNASKLTEVSIDFAANQAGDSGDLRVGQIRSPQGRQEPEPGTGTRHPEPGAIQ